MPDSYAFEGWGNWPTWAVYPELSCDVSAWAKWVSVARRVREEAEERPGLPADTAALGALSALPRGNIGSPTGPFGVGAPEHRPSRVGMRPCGLAARGRLALG